VRTLKGMADHETTWLGTAEAARYLGITPRTLYRLIDEGQVPAYKLGRVIRLRTSDLEAFIDSVRIEPGTLEHLYPERKAESR
jgi:excisionase family DNA binding protein